MVRVLACTVQPEITAVDKFNEFDSAPVFYIS